MDIKTPTAILGSTGSIGTQSLDVAAKNGIPITAVAACRNVKLVEEQVRKFNIPACAMSDENAAKDLKIKLADTDVKVYPGEDGICRMVEETNAGTVVNSIIGKAGLMPTLSVIRSGKRLALANKESLVVAGETVMREASERHTEVVPVDSEHCAIHQCLRAGDKKKEFKRILLTASGGPFFGMKKDKLENVTINEVLAHPTWNMGAKITVDSATLMNKGFEVIEAMHLFDVSADQIKVLVHRESIIHSMVEYIDNSVIAQLSVPDMRFCIQYALSYPERIDAVSNELDLAAVSKLSFADPDLETFSLLSLAFKAAKHGGAMPAVLNAANEVAVDAFLKQEIGFTAITDTVTSVFEKLIKASDIHDIDGIIEVDAEARKIASEYVNKNININR